MVSYWPRCVATLALLAGARACTNILVSPTASAEAGAAMVGYNDDSSRRHGLVTHFDAAAHADGATRPVWDYDTGVLLGEIPQPPSTYGVMANANEVGLVIGETTHGGIAELTVGTDNGGAAVLDYGSLIYTTLQRAATAREVRFGSIKPASSMRDRPASVVRVRGREDKNTCPLSLSLCGARRSRRSTRSRGSTATRARPRASPSRTATRCVFVFVVCCGAVLCFDCVCAFQRVS